MGSFEEGSVESGLRMDLLKGPSHLKFDPGLPDLEWDPIFPHLYEDAVLPHVLSDPLLMSLFYWCMFDEIFYEYGTTSFASAFGSLPSLFAIRSEAPSKM